MKKVLSCFLSCIMMMSCVAMAAPQQTIDAEQQNKNVDLALLGQAELQQVYEDAVQADTGVPQYAELSNEEGDIYHVRMVELPQAQTMSIDEDGIVNYSKSYIATITNDSVVPYYIDGTKTQNNVWDSTGTVSTYLTIYYSENPGAAVPSGNNMIRLTRVTGGWNIADSGVTLSNRGVRVTNWSMANGGCQNRLSSVNSHTFDISYGSSVCPWLEMTRANPAAVKAQTEVTINRGSSSWKFTMPMLNVYNSPPL